MSAEQRDNNLGIDSDLRNRDPMAYEVALRRKLEQLTRGLVRREPPAAPIAPPGATDPGESASGDAPPLPSDAQDA